MMCSSTSSNFRLRHVKSIIFLNCILMVINHVKHMIVAHGIWQHLAFLYDRVTPMKRVALELQQHQLDPMTSSLMRKHINKMQALEHKILHASKSLF